MTPPARILPGIEVPQPVPGSCSRKGPGSQYPEHKPTLTLPVFGGRGLSSRKPGATCFALARGPLLGLAGWEEALPHPGLPSLAPHPHHTPSRGIWCPHPPELLGILQLGSWPSHFLLKASQLCQVITTHRSVFQIPHLSYSHCLSYLHAFRQPLHCGKTLL